MFSWVSELLTGSGFQGTKYVPRVVISFRKPGSLIQDRGGLLTAGARFEWGMDEDFIVSANANHSHVYTRFCQHLFKLIPTYPIMRPLRKCDPIGRDNVAQEGRLGAPDSQVIYVNQ